MFYTWRENCWNAKCFRNSTYLIGNSHSCAKTCVKFAYVFPYTIPWNEAYPLSVIEKIRLPRGKMTFPLFSNFCPGKSQMMRWIIIWDINWGFFLHIFLVCLRFFFQCVSGTHCLAGGGQMQLPKMKLVATHVSHRSPMSGPTWCLSRKKQ